MQREQCFEDVVGFIECAIHSILYARKIYPSSLFEQRRYIDITVWQSRHPDVNSYIRRVVDNARPLLLQGIVDRVVIVCTTSSGTPVDHTTIKCKFGPVVESSNASVDRQVLEEELRSSILRIKLLETQLPRLPEDCGWHVMVVTAVNGSSDGDEALTGALTSGEWYVDNNQSTEQQALSQRVNSSDPSYRGDLASAGGMESTAGGGAGNAGGDSSESSESGRKNQEAPRLLPIKSFQNDLASISVRCYTRCPARLFDADL